MQYTATKNILCHTETKTTQILRKGATYTEAEVGVLLAIRPWYIDDGYLIPS